MGMEIEDIVAVEFKAFSCVLFVCFPIIMECLPFR